MTDPLPPAPPTGHAVAGPSPPPAELRRTLGLARVSLSGIGVILGAGVYALVAPAAGRAGGAMWLSFILAGVVAGLTAYSYARFAALRPKDSPEFQYTAMAFGPTAGFLAGWSMLAADLLAAATVALGFGGYLAHLAATPVTLNAVLLVAVTGLLIYAGIGASIGLAVTLTIVEAAGLLFIVVIGVPAWPRGDYLAMPRGFDGVWSAAALIFFAYLGFDELGNFAEEMRRPERDLPWALLVSMVATTAIYVLVALSIVALVDWRELAASTAPLALVARIALGPSAEGVLGIVALCATANTVLLLLVSASRSVYGMAAAGVLPHALGRVGGRTRVPVAATVAVVGVTAALVFAGDVARVAAMTDMAALLSFAVVNLSLLWLALRRAIPRRRADLVVPAGGALLCGWLMAHTGWAALAATLGILAAGLIIRSVQPRG